MRALLTHEGWVNHPATLMWRRYEWALLQYQEAICFEWTDRGYEDTCLEKTKKLYAAHRHWVEELTWPYWMGDPEFHIRHRSKLLQKDPWHYSIFFHNTPLDLDYLWPEPMADYKNIKPNGWWLPPDPHPF